MGAIVDSLAGRALDVRLRWITEVEDGQNLHHRNGYRRAGAKVCAVVWGISAHLHARHLVERLDDLQTDFQALPALGGTVFQRGTLERCPDTMRRATGTRLLWQFSADGNGARRGVWGGE